MDKERERDRRFAPAAPNAPTSFLRTREFELDVDIDRDRTELGSPSAGELDRVLDGDPTGITTSSSRSLVSRMGDVGKTFSWNRSHKSGRYDRNLRCSLAIKMDI